MQLLSIICMHKITKAANQEPKGLNESLFTDDQCVVNNDMVQFQNHVEHVSTCCENYDMRINTTKIKVISVAQTSGNLSVSISRKGHHHSVEYKT